MAFALCGAGIVWSAGCNSGGGEIRVDDQKQPYNRWTVQELNDESISNAIITQHTLYAYHFVAGSAELNKLGERDCKVLAAHLVRNPGEVNVHRQGEAQALYDARVQSVSKMLAKYDVPASSIKITDKMPGGEGVSTERAVLILKRSYESGPLSGETSGPKNNDTGSKGTTTSTSQGGNKE